MSQEFVVLFLILLPRFIFSLTSPQTILSSSFCLYWEPASPPSLQMHFVLAGLWHWSINDNPCLWSLLWLSGSRSLISACPQMWTPKWRICVPLWLVCHDRWVKWTRYLSSWWHVHLNMCVNMLRRPLLEITLFYGESVVPVLPGFLMTKASKMTDINSQSKLPLKMVFSIITIAIYDL